LDKDISGRLFQETCNDIEQRGFPASGRTDNANELALQNFQINRSENFNRFTPLFANESQPKVPDADDRCAHDF